MHKTHVGGRRGFDHALLAMTMAGLLLASAVVAPAVSAQSGADPGTGIDLLGGSAGTFTFEGTSLGEPVSGTFDFAGGDDTLPEHPGAIRIDSTSSGTFTFDAIGTCPTAIVGRNLPGDFDIKIRDGRTGASQRYERAGGAAGINLIHPDALPCPADGTAPPPRRISGDTVGKLGAGNRRQCLGMVQYQTVLDSRGKNRSHKLGRIFAGGAGRDSLRFVDGDRPAWAAAYHARKPGYSAVLLVQQAGDDGLTGILAEGRPKRFGPRDARSLLARIASGEPRQDILDDLAKPGGTCAWNTRTDIQQGGGSVAAYFDALVPRPDPVIAPADASRFSDDPVGPGAGSLEFTIDNVSAPTEVTPIQPDDSGVFWFSSPEDPEPFLRVFDGCEANEHFWVFAAGQTAVEGTITITDQRSGTTVTYPTLGATSDGFETSDILDPSSWRCDVP